MTAKYRHPLYSRWHGMINRCENPRHPAYYNYGGRGISVCAEWHDFDVFARWIELNLGPRPDGMSLDRTDNDGGYEPGNVRWADRSTQAANQRKREKWSEAAKTRIQRRTDERYRLARERAS